MGEISFRNAWRKSEARLIDDAKAFWRALDALSPEAIEQRAGELCALAYADGEVAAVSTAIPYAFPRLRSRFAFYRTSVASEFRRQRLAARLCAFSRDRLAEWARENPEEKLKGLFVILQAEEFRSRQHVPIYTQEGLKLVLVGYTPGGHQMRVEWFGDATVE